MNLSETDKELISDIVKRLERLEQINTDRNTACIQEPAVDVVEPEYVRLKGVKYWGDCVTEAKIYEVVEHLHGRVLIIDNENVRHEISDLYYDIATKAEYLAQQKEVEKEWKVGKWGKGAGSGCLGTIEEFVTDKCALLNPQDGTDKFAANIDILIKPTEKEVEDWLKGIAERKYPVGTKVKSYFSGTVKEITDNNFFLNYDGALHYGIRGEDDIEVWCNGKWAEISEPKPEERFNIAIVTNHSKYEVRVTGIENQEQAIKISNDIKNTLLS